MLCRKNSGVHVRFAPLRMLNWNEFPLSLYFVRPRISLYSEVVRMHRTRLGWRVARQSRSPSRRAACSPPVAESFAGSSRTSFTASSSPVRSFSACIRKINQCHSTTAGVAANDVAPPLRRATVTAPSGCRGHLIDIASGTGADKVVGAVPQRHHVRWLRQLSLRRGPLLLVCKKCGSAWFTRVQQRLIKLVP